MECAQQCSLWLQTLLFCIEFRHGESNTTRRSTHRGVLGGQGCGGGTGRVRGTPAEQCVWRLDKKFFVQETVFDPMRVKLWKWHEQETVAQGCLQCKGDGGTRAKNFQVNRALCASQINTSVRISETASGTYLTSAVGRTSSKQCGLLTAAHVFRPNSRTFFHIFILKNVFEIATFLKVFHVNKYCKVFWVKTQSRHRLAYSTDNVLLTFV